MCDKPRRFRRDVEHRLAGLCARGNARSAFNRCAGTAFGQAIESFNARNNIDNLIAAYRANPRLSRRTDPRHLVGFFGNLIDGSPDFGQGSLIRQFPFDWEWLAV
jgi:hypothetical protein